MAQYRSKVVVVTASQWNAPGDHQAVTLYQGQQVVLGAQGVVAVNPGDWIISESVGGGYYPCQDAVFQAKYEGPIPELAP